MSSGKRDNAESRRLKHIADTVRRLQDKHKRNPEAFLRKHIKEQVEHGITIDPRVANEFVKLEREHGKSLDDLPESVQRAYIEHELNKTVANAVAKVDEDEHKDVMSAMTALASGQGIDWPSSDADDSASLPSSPLSSPPSSPSKESGSRRTRKRRRTLPSPHDDILDTSTLLSEVRGDLDDTLQSEIDSERGKSQGGGRRKKRRKGTRRKRVRRKRPVKRRRRRRRKLTKRTKKRKR